MSQQRVLVNGVSIGVEITTPAQPQQTLVLLHGFTGSAASWHPLTKQFVEAGIRVIALDMLGHGHSDAPVQPERYEMQHCQADIIAVLQYMGIQRGEAILLGYSMGGRIALYCAFSGFFRALILESASPGLATAEERVRRQQSDNELAARIEREGIQAFVDHWEKLPLFASQRHLPASRWEEQRKQRMQNRPQGLANSLRGVGTGVQPALHDQLSTLTLPTLLITGALDQKFCTIAGDMVQAIPHAQWQVVPCAGHTIHLEQPDQFAQLVTNFCTIELHQHAYTKSAFIETE